MRKKWVIIAATVFLGVLCGVILLNKKDRYSPEEVIAEMAVHGNFYEYPVNGCSFGVPLGAKLGRPSVFQRVADWYNTFLANRKMTSSELLYSKSGSDHYSSITLYEKGSRIYEVEIEPEHKAEAAQDALDLQSKLSKAFPDLPCKITGNVELDVSNP